jgi:hypothetical protein
MTDHELHIRRAEEASRVVNSQAFADAFDEVRAAYLKTWEGLPSMTDDKGQQHARDLHTRLKALADVRKALETHIQTGKLAQKELNRRQRAVEYAKRLIPFAQNSRSI